MRVSRLFQVSRYHRPSKPVVLVSNKMDNFPKESFLPQTSYSGILLITGTIWPLSRFMASQALGTHFVYVETSMAQAENAPRREIGRKRKGPGLQKLQCDANKCLENPL